MIEKQNETKTTANTVRECKSAMAENRRVLRTCNKYCTVAVIQMSRRLLR
jgi:hypothetical protein